MKKINPFIVFTFIIVLSNCEIQKRTYRSGYYVSGKNKQQSQPTSFVVTRPSNNSIEQITASADNFCAKKETAKFKLIALASDSCDLVYFKDGTQIKAKIIDLTNKELQYQYCDFEDQKIHVSSRLLLVRIEYANGVIEDFENGVSVKVQPGKTHQMTDVPKPAISSPAAVIDTLTSSVTVEKANATIANSCERIMFRDGSEAEVKLIEITPDDVRYKMCDMLNGPVFVKDKSDIFMVVHQNGTKEIFNKVVVSQPVQNYTIKPVRPRNGLAITGFVFSLLGFYPFIGIGSLVGLILGLIYMKKHRLNPEVYDHPKLAKTAIILGAIVLGIIAAAIVISLL